MAVYAANHVNPDFYAAHYLRFILAGIFEHPNFNGEVVQNTKLTVLMKQLLAPHPNEEELRLVSGLQQSGKSFSALRECNLDKRTGFFIDLGLFRSNACMEEFFDDTLTKNSRVAHSPWKKFFRIFLPFPKPSSICPGFEVSPKWLHVHTSTLQ